MVEIKLFSLLVCQGLVNQKLHYSATETTSLVGSTGSSRIKVMTN